jgi:hypothetical protein
MTRLHWLPVGLLVFLGALIPLSAARANFEVTGPDGRRILLKDDGTWRYQEAVGDEKPADRPKVSGEGVLSLERRVEEGPNCRFGLRLANNTNYEIQNIVPYIAAYRANGVLYDTLGVGFFSIKPGNSLHREVVFQGITCPEIARLQVTGGDRCVMGDLDRFSAEAGKCLERVRVVASDLVRFEK